MRIINNTESLIALFSNPNRNLYIYGAGYQGSHLLKYLRFNISLKPDNVKIKSILVTDKKGNPDVVEGIPVIQYDKSVFDNSDGIIIAVDNRIKGEIIDYLKDCRAELIDIYTGIIRYEDVYKRIEPLINNYPNNIMGINKPVDCKTDRTVWSCWWQGEENAPMLVKACWQSQRKNLSKETRHVIITKDNYSDYITIPDYVLKKFEDNKNLMAHLADFIRSCLLYKYGGVWLDATALQIKELPEECWTLPLYSWRSNVLDSMATFNTESIWATWFLAAQKGSVLYQFVMEAFLYYLSVYDKISDYFTIDFFISIGTHILDDVSEQFAQIPENNKTATQLQSHFNEPYSQEKFYKYCEGTLLQKLNRHKENYEEDSFYYHLINGVCKD